MACRSAKFRNIFASVIFIAQAPYVAFGLSDEAPFAPCCADAVPVPQRCPLWFPVRKGVCYMRLSNAGGSTMAMRGLTGKTAIVTGAAGGIGSAVTARLLDEGCRVVAVDLAEEAVRRSCPAGADRLHVVAADVSTDKGPQSYVEAAVRRFSGVDLFFNNAGIFGQPNCIVDMPVEDFDRIMAVNVRGVFLGLQ